MWEAHLIRQHLYDAGAVNSRFVPVLFCRRFHTRMFPLGQKRDDLRVETEEGYEQLYRLLTGQHDTPMPPRGQNPGAPAAPPPSVSQS
jgi:hypothetical protein